MDSSVLYQAMSKFYDSLGSLALIKHTVKWFQVLLCNLNNAIQYYLLAHREMVSSIAI